jgi:hypothetical protein
VESLRHQIKAKRKASRKQERHTDKKRRSKNDQQSQPANKI